MEKILVSACLCGQKTRFDGNSNPFPFIEKLKRHYDVVPFCPEVEGGLPIPRESCEIVNNAVLSESGKDYTKQYVEGAKKAVSICHFFGIKIAILKDRSPSCGSRTIHDGSFKNNMIEGLGLTARALIADGIKVYADTDALDFLIPEEKKKKGFTKSKHVAKRPLEKKPHEEGEKKPFRKAKSPAKGGYKRKEDHKFGSKEGKPARKSFGGKKAFSKKPYGKPRRSSGKPFNQKTPK